MADREKVIKGFRECMGEGRCTKCVYGKETPMLSCKELLWDALELLKEQEELLKHEYWRGYNNGRADERGLQEGTIMQTFSPD